MFRDLPTTPEWPLEQGPEPALRLLVVADDQASSYPLTRGVHLVGRTELAQLCINSQGVSRRHARILVNEDIHIEDCHSANGTRVRGQRLQPGEVMPLHPGDCIDLGSRVTLVVQGSTHQQGPQTHRDNPPEATMGDVLRLAQRVAHASICVLLQGDTGVGKEVLARKIHAWSPRAEMPFVAINCSALTSTLFASELFGYEKGAFTGATRAKAGLLESAYGGTVLLDEIGDMPADFQVALLRVFEQREILPVGAVRPKPIDVRFLAATHRNLHDEVRSGRFREDLFYRLQGISLTIPSLRRRTDEIPGLAKRFLTEASTGTALADVASITEPAMALLQSYEWPGNIRELKQVIEQALVVSGGPIDAAHLPAPLHAPPADAQACTGQGSTTSAGPRPAAATPIGGPQTPRKPQTPLRGTLQEIERQQIREALDYCGGNQTRAAKLLGISRGTLINRMERFGMRRPQKG